MTTESTSVFLLPNAANGSDIDRPCNLLPSTNSSLPLAQNWENIPETLLLNGTIGFILYILFIFMTRIAWSRSTSGDDLINQSLISFLYGYRDPDRWYVIPRFEFLGNSGRHHNHDLESPNIYVPPKLPLANPIELFAFDSGNQDESKSVEETPSADDKRMQKQATQFLKPKSITRTKKDQLAKPFSKRIATYKLDLPNESPMAIKTAKTLPIGSSPMPPQSAINSAPAINGGGANLVKVTSRLAPLDQSFFYPSILTAEQVEASYLSRKLNHFFSIFFRITDADIIYAKGLDAYEYLLFQRHLIFIMFITNLFCLGIILPVHWFSGENHLEANSIVFSTSFQRSTIKNMSQNSIYYWAHVVSSICIVVLTMLVLSSYRESRITKNDTQLARRTLLIGNIPADQRNRIKLSEVIRKYFTKSTIEAIQFIYDTSLLEQYQLQLDAIMVAKEYCFYYKRKYNQEIMVNPTDVNEDQRCNGNCRLCSFFYVCCCYWPKETKQPGSVFYTQREQYYRDKIRTTCEQLVKQPSEYAFVTFKTYKQAKRVMKELTRLKTEALGEKLNARTLTRKSPAPGRKSLDSDVGSDSSKVGRILAPSVLVISGTSVENDPLDPKNNPHVRSIRSPIIATHKLLKKTTAERSVSSKERSTSVAKLEGPIAWSIRYAPHPDNVEYYDVLNIATASKYTNILLHALMIIIFIFITTPNVVLSILERWSVLQPEKAKEMTGFQGLMINYFSILLQIITTAILPGLITIISRQIPYEDTSSKNHSVMWKVYLFLVLMVIIMPSVGMSSAQAFLSSELNPKCLFPTDNGAYFINYVVSSIFLSTMLELIKPVDILSYYFILLTGRSFADFEGGRQYIEREFSVSMQHTGVLLVFSVVMTYAISCPLIAPAGLIFLLVKHAVDHYHLFYTYFTKKVDKNLQNTIEIFVKVALLLMLFQTTVAISINTGTSYFSLISQIVFVVTLAVFLFNCFFDCTARAMMTTKRSRYQREFCACFYLPRAIENLLRANAIPDNCISRKV